MIVAPLLSAPTVLLSRVLSGLQVGGIVLVAIGCLVAMAAAVAPATSAEPTVKSYAKLPVLRPGFPVPPRSRLQFGYMQRSQNANTVIYEVRKTRDGRIDPKNPVRIRWRRYASDGAWRPLSQLERWVFGVRTRAIAGSPNQFSVNFNLLPSRVGRLHLDQRGQAVVDFKIGSRPAKLIYIYIKLRQRALVPTVDYVDIVGQAADAEIFLVERIHPTSRDTKRAIAPGR